MLFVEWPPIVVNVSHCAWLSHSTGKEANYTRNHLLFYKWAATVMSVNKKVQTKNNIQWVVLAPRQQLLKPMIMKKTCFTTMLACMADSTKLLLTKKERFHIDASVAAQSDDQVASSFHHSPAHIISANDW